MTLHKGIFLNSTNALKETFFSDAVIFITEYDEKGAVGFIVNRPFERSLHELLEFSHSRAFPLYTGGPVDREHLFVLHRRPELIAGGEAVAGGVYFGGHFTQLVAAVNANRLTENDVKILVGYCGWEWGGLEAEIREGSWTISKAPPQDLFY